MLNVQCKTVFTTPLGNPSNEFFVTTVALKEMKIIDIKIEETDVIWTIGEISSNSTTGPDEFPAILLKKCNGGLAWPLPILFQRLYILVSLTIHASNGKHCQDETVFFEDNNFLPDTEHGFHSDRSCLTQLLQHYEWVLKGIIQIQM